MSRARLVVAALLALLAIGGPLAGAAAATCPKTTLGDLEDEVMCVRCGRPLNTVDREPQAVRERAYIQDAIDKCWSKEQIKDGLVSQFGPDVLAIPENKGFDASAFIVPVLVPLAALGLIALTATRWRRRRPGGGGSAAARPAAAAGPSIDADDAARLEEDLERYKL